MAKQKRIYDCLPQIPFGKRPKILLVGNGLNLSFEGAKKTDSIIQTEWEKYYGTKLPDREDKKAHHEIWNLPFPLQVVAATKDHVQGCMTELSDTFKNQSVTTEQEEFIKGILDTGFDAVLSANYSLEFEKSTIKEFSQYKVYSCYKTTQEQTTWQKRLGVFQCIELPYNNHPLLWHIHGTALRKGSMVMGQLYYGKLLSEVIARADKVNVGYRKAVKEKQPFLPKSWIDYLLIGDVYIMGFRLDFSESDIWWLLSYKKSAFSGAKTFFYDGSISGEKQLMFSCYDVQMPSVEFNNRGKRKYINYYKSICSSIKNEKD